MSDFNDTVKKSSDKLDEFQKLKKENKLLKDKLKEIKNITSNIDNAIKTINVRSYVNYSSLLILEKETDNLNSVLNELNKQIS